MPTLARVRWSAALAVTLVLASCSSTGARTDPAAAVEGTTGDATAAGTAVTGTTVLHAILPIDTGEGKPFADEVGRLSGGAVRVQLDSGWHATSLTAERDAIAAVKSGDVDLGIVPARAFHDAGVTAFDALVAPMTINSLDLEVAVLKHPLVADMLHALEGTGLTGIGVLPGPIRYPSGITRPLTSPADYAGANIAISPSPVAERSLQALGATTTATPFEHADISGFDGAELQASAVHGNDYDKVITDIVGNAGLWPRPLVIIANRAKIGALPIGQANVLTTAADNAIDTGADAVRSDEKINLEAMCRTGTPAIVAAPATDLDALHSAFEPVYAWLNQDPPTRDMLLRIQKVKAAEQTTGGSLSCPVGTTQPRSPAPSPLDGVWELSYTLAEAAAWSGSDPAQIEECNYGTYRWEFNNGKYTESQHAGTTQTWASGTYSVDGNTLTMDATDGGGSGPGGNCHIRGGDEFIWTFAIEGDTLTVAWFDPTATDFPANYTVKSWRRAGDAAATVSSTR